MKRKKSDFEVLQPLGQRKKGHDMGAHLSDLELSRMLDGEYVDSTVHMDRCDHCRQRFTALKRLWDELELWEASDASPYFYTRLKHRLTAPEPRRMGHPGWVVALSVGVALMLGFLMGAVTGRHISEPSGQAVPQMATSMEYVDDDGLVDAYMQLIDEEK